MERSSFVEGVLDWQVLLGATSRSPQATHNPDICPLTMTIFRGNIEYSVLLT